MFRCKIVYSGSWGLFSDVIVSTSISPVQCSFIKLLHSASSRRAVREIFSRLHHISRSFSVWCAESRPHPDPMHKYNFVLYHIPQYAGLKLSPVSSCFHSRNNTGGCAAGFVAFPPGGWQTHPPEAHSSLLQKQKYPMPEKGRKQEVQYFTQERRGFWKMLPLGSVRNSGNSKGTGGDSKDTEWKIWAGVEKQHPQQSTQEHTLRFLCIAPARFAISSICCGRCGRILLSQFFKVSCIRLLNLMKLFCNFVPELL